MGKLAKHPRWATVAANTVRNAGLNKAWVTAAHDSTTKTPRWT